MGGRENLKYQWFVTEGKNQHIWMAIVISDKIVFKTKFVNGEKIKAHCVMRKWSAYWENMTSISLPKMNVYSSYIFFFLITWLQGPKLVWWLNACGQHWRMHLIVITGCFNTPLSKPESKTRHMINKQIEKHYSITRCL